MHGNATRVSIASTAIALLAASTTGALAEKKYDIGATDTEIKIGNIIPYSGPASSYSVIGKTEQAYFNKVNAEGGINGRKINFISYDDGFSRPKTVEQARKLVESADIKAWNAFLDKYYPDANRTDQNVIYGYAASQSMVEVLKRCGDDLTRANIMKQAASPRDFTVQGLLPGVKINTSPTDFAPMDQMQLMRFKGDTWERFDDVVSSDVSD